MHFHIEYRYQELSTVNGLETHLGIIMNAPKFFQELQFVLLNCNCHINNIH